MPTNITIKNTNQRNSIKVSIENLEVTVNAKDKSVKKDWKSGIDTYLKPGESTDAWAAETRKIIIQEMPT